MKYFFTGLFMLLTSGLIFGQISVPGTPPSEKQALNSKIDHYYMPSFDLERLLLEDEMEQQKGGVPPRFGHKMDVKITPKNAGTWEELADGSRVWRLKITSLGAHSINLLFEEFYMPRGAEFYIYNSDRSYQIGAFTMLNNKDDLHFATAPVKGETVILEYYEPSYSLHLGKIHISHVTHAYKNLFETAEEIAEKGFGDSGSCNNDVACPETAGWEDEIRSVALMIDGGFRFCTGAVVNNTAQDGTPYFLGANHCGIGIDNQWIFVFNYDSPTCNGSDGSLAQSITGGTLRANYGPSDVALFELSSPPPAAYVVFYSGWNNGTAPASESVGIHHPSGDVKKWSINDDALYSGNWGSGAANIPSGNHWIVDNWEDGTTEGGSSGSPLYDQNHHIVGQLHGGGASCSNVTYDSYGKFDVSWTGGGTNSSRLSNWLDPSGSGVQTLDGAYFIDPPLAINMQAASISGADGINCSNTVAPIVTVKNIGATDITSFDIEYAYDNGAVSTESWTGPALGFFQSVDVQLPSTTLGIGIHDIDITVINPNGMVDLDTSDDSATSSFEIVDGNTLTVDLLTDNFPQETSYEIQDLNGNVLYSAASFGAQATHFIDDYCLADGCYNFVIFDSYGDGICCGQFGDGGYTILDENGAELGSGGVFGSSDMVMFCLPNTALSAGFMVDETYCVGVPVVPTNTSANAVNYTWTASGATNPNQTGETPSFIFDTPGNYTIELTVDDGMGNNSNATANIVVADSPATPPQMAGPTVSENNATNTYAVPPSGGSIYTWTVTGGTQISGGNTNLAGVTWDAVSTMGEICVTVTDANGCTSEALCVSVDLGTTSIEELLAVSGLEIYPNPTSSAVNIEMRKQAERIQIFNTIGQMVENIEQPDLNTRVNLPSTEGIYLVRVIFAEGNVTQKVTVAR